jgi:hypothetical protein
MKSQKYESIPGNHISESCREAVAIAKRDNCNVAFDFNEIPLVAAPSSDPAELERAYSRECDRRHEAYIASPEYKQRQDEQARKERERADKLNAILRGAPEAMTLKDADGWAKANAANRDGYGGAVMSYAERWARVMEARIARGEKLEDIADDSSHLADTEGITGFMYGAAVSTLAAVWVHGESLRRWHNLKTQLRNEGEKANQSGGVLNPAMLTIG